MHRGWLRKLTWSVAGAAALFAFFVWLVLGAWPVPAVCGNLRAHIDMARGRPQLLEVGLPAVGRSRFKQILQERYGVEASVVGYCTVSQFTLDYVDAYDDVIESAYQKKYGRNVFREASDEAVAAWKAQSANQRP